ncbi:MAG: hypothetical protein K8U57_03555 [Planctomycetes bacterium]|nr:hypothetical protein [Planctomycetota bacterium]
MPVETKKLGRPTTLTPELQESLCRDLANGCSRKTAATCNGISRRTLCRWLSSGRAGDEPFLSLMTAVRKAEAIAVRRNVIVIQKAATGDPDSEVAPDWRAAAWWLERMHPEEFGRHRSELKALRLEIAELRSALNRITAERTRFGSVSAN